MFVCHFQVLADNLPGQQFVEEMFKLLNKKSSDWYVNLRFYILHIPCETGPQGHQSQMYLLTSLAWNSANK